MNHFLKRALKSKEDLLKFLETVEDNEALFAVQEVFPENKLEWEISKKIRKMTNREAQDQGLMKSLFLDTETTGLEDEDEITEISIIPVYFEKKGDEYIPVGFGEGYCELNDPGFPIPQEVVEITGITDEDVKGKKIDWGMVASEIESSMVLVAHNAYFDRGVLMKYLPKEVNKKIWACSVTDIDWKKKGAISRKQEILTLGDSFTYTGHRARVDVLALIRMVCCLEKRFNEMLINSKRPKVFIKALYADYSTKDKLKQMGFKWIDPKNCETKAWSKIVYKEEEKEVVDKLKAEIYRGRGEPIVCDIPPNLYHAKMDYIFKNLKK